MSPDDQHLAENPVANVFDSLIVAFDEALASGTTPPAVDPTAIPAELASKLRNAQACLAVLHQTRRARSIGSSESSDPVPSLALAGDVPRPNSQIGPFQIIREIGRGGYGVVFLALDTRLRRQVALKVPRPEVLVTAELSRRFILEAQAASSLAHPNLVTVYEVGEDGPFCYIASEYCNGPDMAQWLKHQTARVPVRQSAQLLAALADGVENAHRHGVLHRDIKPSNVLLEPSPNELPGDGVPAQRSTFIPKLTDFGLARLHGALGDATRSGALLGTPSYMAPEQAAGRLDEIGPPTDVYGLGTILYELLTGQRAFQGTSDVDTLRRVLESEPVGIRNQNSDVPRDLEAICLKCLEHQPKRRYATAAQLAADLRRFLAGEPTLARANSPVQRLLKWTRRRPALAGLLSVTVAASLAFIALTATYIVRLQTANDRAEVLSGKSQASASAAEMHARVANQFLYAARMKLAYQSLEQGGLESAVEIVAAYEPGSSLSDLRGFEWYHLKRRLHGERLSLKGHRGEVYCVAFSPDGRFVASGGQDGLIKFWDPASGQELASIAGHNSCVNTIAFSPDGQLFATGSCDSSIKLWDAQTRELLDTLEGHSDTVACLAFSPTDSNRLASCGNDPHARIWDLATRETLATLKTAGRAIHCLAWRNDGKALYVGGAGPDNVHNSVVMWDLENNQNATYPGNVLCIATSPLTGNQCVGLIDGTMREFAPGLSESTVWYAGAARTDSLAFSPLGELLASGSDWTIRIWDAERNVRTQTLTGHVGRVQALAFAPRDSLLASASFDGTIKLWDPAGSERRMLQAPFYMTPITNPKHVIAFSSDLRYFALQAAEDQATVMDTSDGSCARTVTLASEPRGLHFLAEQPVLFGLPIQSSTIGELWDVVQWKSLGGYALPDELRALALSGDGRDLAMISHNRLDIMETATGQTWCPSDQLVTPPYLASTVPRMKLSPDGKTLGVELGLERGLIVDLRRMQISRPSRNWCREVSNGGEWIVVGSGNRSLILVDTQSDGELATLRHDGNVRETALSPDNKTLAVSCEDGFIYLWNTPTGQEITRLKALEGTLVKLQFSTDGRKLAAVDLADPRGVVRGTQYTASVVIWSGLQDD